MFNKILVPIDIDYPKTAAAVYTKVAALARISNAEVKLVSVLPGFGMPIVASYITEKQIKEATEKYKAALEAFIKNNCSESVSYTLRNGKNWEEILKVADKWSADLIVVYHNHRRSKNEAFSDSCSRRIAAHANCSVLRLRQIMMD